jgi:hypothetical protein
MKVYCFYLYGDELTTNKYAALPYDNTRMSNEFMYSLYGFTNNKKIAGEFRKSRDMNIFFEKTMDMSSKEYEALSEDKMECEIRHYPYKIPAIRDDKITVELMFITSTTSEYNKICFDGTTYLNKVYSDTYKNMTYIRPTDFNDILSITLRKVFNYYDVLDWVRQIDSLPDYSFDINTCSLYFHVFGNTYNEERMSEACNYGDSLRNLA